MATIKNSLELQDKMSKYLNGVIKKLNATEKAMNRFGKSATFNDQNMAISIRKTTAAIESFMQTEGLAITQTNKLGQAAAKNSGIFDKLRKSLIAQFSIGAIIATLVMSGIYALGDLVKQSIQTASDIVETQNVIEVAYQGNTKAVDAWSKNTLDKFGINELGAKKYAGRMSAMLQSGGISSKQAGEMSMRLTELAGDLASFYNISNQEAFTKLRSGMAGTVMPLRQLGIDMTVASLQSHAFAMGIKDKWKNLSQAQKQLVRYDYLMKVTGAIQGDFNRTFLSFANQQRLVGENWAMFSAHLAQVFLPIMALGLLAVNKTIKGLEALGSGLKTLMPYILGISSVILVSQIPAITLWSASMVKAGGIAIWTGLKAAAGWAIANWPLTLGIALVVSLIYILQRCGITFEQVTGVAGGALFGLIAVIKNVGIAIGKYIIGQLQMVLGMWDVITQGIDKVAHTKFNTHVKDAQKVADNIQKSLKYKDVGAEAKMGYKAGKQFGIGLKNDVGQLFKQPNFGLGKGGFGADTGKAPKGTKNDPMYTKLDDKDIKALVEVAKINYVNKFIKMQPKLEVQFGDVHETADVHAVVGVLNDMLAEAHASALGE